jgi:uncharacterized protein YxjI
MKYVMRQKLFCLGDDFTIQDERGRDAFYVDGKVFTLRQTLAFLDGHGREQARIVKRLLALRPVYDLERGGRTIATVKKQLFTLFRCKFTIDVPGPDDYEAVGSFIDHDYHFERGGRTVATVSKKWFRLTDTYGVDVADGEDALVILASTVVIDLCCHEEQDGKKGH